MRKLGSARSHSEDVVSKLGLEPRWFGTQAYRRRHCAVPSLRGQGASCVKCTLLLEAVGLRLFPWEQGGGEEGMLWASSGLSALGDGQWETESLASAFPGVKGCSLEDCPGHGLLSRCE